MGKGPLSQAKSMLKYWLTNCTGEDVGGGEISEEDTSKKHAQIPTWLFHSSLSRCSSVHRD